MTLFSQDVYNFSIELSIYCEAGGVAVAQVKRVMITMTDSLLEEVDGLAKQENRNRSEFIREVMRCYIDDRRRRELRETLREGYCKMSQLNRELAEEGVTACEQAFALYEEVLARSNGA